MSLSVARKTPTGIPLEKDISSRLLPWLVAVMVYLVGLSIFSAVTMTKVSGQWDASLSAHMTIQLPPPELSNDSQPTNLEALLKLVDETPGVRSSRVLEEVEMDRLMEPWLGESGQSLDLALPMLIAVTLKSGADVDASGLALRIREIAPDAIVVDHKSGLEGLIDLAGWVRLISAGVIVLVAFSATLMAILITKMGLAAHAPVIELLHLMGAEDRFVAAQFQNHALTGGLMGGLIGLVFSLSTIAMVEQVTRGLDHELVPDLSLTGAHWALLFALPLASAAVTTLTVRVTVLRNLARMP